MFSVSVGDKIHGSITKTQVEMTRGAHVLQESAETVLE